MENKIYINNKVSKDFHSENSAIKIDTNLHKSISPYTKLLLNTEMDDYCQRMDVIKGKLMKQTELAHMDCIVESSEEKPIIGTQALDTCYGILFYDKKNKKGIAGHGSPGHQGKILYSMIKMIDDGTPKTIEYSIVSGYRNVERNNYDVEAELRKILENYQSENLRFVPFKELDVRLNDSTLTYEFALDTRSGQFLNKYVFFDAAEVHPLYISTSRFR